MSWLTAKLYAIGAGLLALGALILRLQVLKNQRDKARVMADTLKVRHHTIQVQKVLKRKEEKKLLSHRAEIVKELSKEKEDFTGIDSLTDSNDF